MFLQFLKKGIRPIWYHGLKHCGKSSSAGKNLLKEAISLEKFIPLKKQSKKAQKAYYAGHRRLWSRAPQTQVIPSGKLYRRCLEQKDPMFKLNMI